MSAITQAFYDTLTGDGTLTGLLGTYSGAASVFTEMPLPADFDIAANGPYILTDGEVSVVPGDTDVKNASGRTLDRDIRCYAAQSLSPATVESIAERVRDLFHRQTISITGFTTDIATVSGPITLDEEDALGRVLTVSLILTEP